MVSLNFSSGFVAKGRKRRSDKAHNRAQRRVQTGNIGDSLVGEEGLLKGGVHALEKDESHEGTHPICHGGTQWGFSDEGAE